MGSVATRIYGPNCGRESERLPKFESALAIGRSWRRSTGKAGKWENIWCKEAARIRGTSGPWVGLAADDSSLLMCDVGLTIICAP